MSFDENRRPTSLLAGLLPGLRCLAVLFPLILATAPTVSADHHAAAAEAGAADPMKAMMDERLAGIPSGEEGVSRIMGELDTRLDLSEAQEADIRPIIQDTVASMERTRDKFKAGEISPMALGMQLQMAGQKAATKVETHLTETQKVEYEKMRQEQRREMMKAMQQARGMASPAGGQ